MARIQITPTFVNPPKKEGGKFGSLNTKDNVRYDSDWANIAHCQPNVTYEMEVEVQTWKGKGGYPDSDHNVIKSYAQPVGELPAGTPQILGATAGPPTTATPPIPAPQGAVASSPPAVQVTMVQRNGAQDGMLFNTIKEVKMAGLDLPDSEIVQWYIRALNLSDMLDKAKSDHNSN